MQAGTDSKMVERYPEASNATVLSREIAFQGAGPLSSTPGR